MMSGGLAKCMLLMMMMGCAQVGIWVDICSAKTLHLGMIYRYSDEFKALMEARNNKKPVEGWWTMEGTVEHHQKLIKRDRHRHAGMRNLISSKNGTYSLSPTNETASVDNLGGLHYSLITIGTPSLSFLVALDTGSDLLWVPCNCQQCSATNWASYGLQSQNLEFSVYNLSNSNTRKLVSCSDSLCSSTLSSSNCTNANENCNYLVDYASANTSTSGVLVEDVLYLNSETSSGGTITTPIYFGCGEVQTGDLVEGVAPDGLFGLGPNDISVPSTLARNGIVSKSFSMCFSSSDSSGRLVFGSQGKTGIQNTSLIPTNPSVYYVIMATKWAINKDSVVVSEELIFDTGTSYTTLPYSDSQNIGKIFNQKINLPQFQLNGTFDFCWNISDSDDLDSLPSLTITFSGGSTWDITTPYLTFVDSVGNVQFFCLGIIPSSSSSSGIIGHNFMGGYEFFFDQESMTFGWASSDCYNPNASSTVKSPQGPTIINVNSTPSSTPSSSGAQSEPNRAFHNLSILSFHIVLLFSFMTLNLLYIR